MKKRAAVCALVFIVLTGVKLLLPAEAAKLRAHFVPAISSDTDLREEAISLGRALSGSGSYIYASEQGNKADTAESGSAEAARSSPGASAAAGFELSEMVEQNLSGFESPGTSSAPVSTAPSPATSSGTQAATATPESEEDTASAQSEKVDSFMREQEAFSDYAVPANVNYDALTLPFAASAPAESEISSCFGYRYHPVYGDVRFHYGTDFAVVDGDSVLAFADGTVSEIQEINGYGQTVLIDHGEGYTTLYAHLGQILVEVGDTVKRGDKIALAGHSGLVTGPNLHFELKHNGNFLNPEFYI